MINVALLGKEYQDFNFSLSNVCIGETNKADNLTKEFGGVYNLLKPQIENINFLFFTQGTKDAFIINEKQKSRRTSITRDGKESIYKQKDISTINKSCDWAHVCYIDDIEDYSSFFSENKHLDPNPIAPRGEISRLGIPLASIVFPGWANKSEGGHVQLGLQLHTSQHAE